MVKNLFKRIGAAVVVLLLAQVIVYAQSGTNPSTSSLLTGGGNEVPGVREQCERMRFGIFLN